MPRYAVALGVEAALENFVLPERLGFGAVHAPVMFAAHWSQGEWTRGELRPYGPIDILPGARALQYAELVFEGLKAYRVAGSGPNLFRPRENWLRLHRSAQRLAMPPVPEALFLEGIDAVAGACERIIPRESGRALYLRPFLFGTEAGYLLRNSSTFSFMVIANPVEIYASGPIRVAIERDDVRAVVERRMALDELLAQTDSGECSEVFACGTAAIVSPIGILADREPRQYVPRRVDAVAAHLREALLAIQERRAPDPFGWTRDVAIPATGFHHGS